MERKLEDDDDSRIYGMVCWHHRHGDCNGSVCVVLVHGSIYDNQMAAKGNVPVRLTE